MTRPGRRARTWACGADRSAEPARVWHVTCVWGAHPCVRHACVMWGGIMCGMCVSADKKGNAVSWGCQAWSTPRASAGCEGRKGRKGRGPPDEAWTGQEPERGRTARPRLQGSQAGRQPNRPGSTGWPVGLTATSRSQGYLRAAWEAPARRGWRRGSSPTPPSGPWAPRWPQRSLTRSSQRSPGGACRPADGPAAPPGPRSAWQSGARSSRPG